MHQLSFLTAALALAATLSVAVPARAADMIIKDSAGKVSGNTPNASRSSIMG